MRGRECNRGKSAPERLYWRKESKGEDGIERTSVSWELFFISQAESCALSPENTHSAAFLSAHYSFPFTPFCIHSTCSVPSITLIYFLICFICLICACSLRLDPHQLPSSVPSQPSHDRQTRKLLTLWKPLSYIAANQSVKTSHCSVNQYAFSF